MEAPELYIPPCCIDKQLPGVIRSADPIAYFYSQGDWGLPKLTHAVESLVDSRDGDVLTILVMSDISADTIDYLRREFRMGWSKAVILVTATDRTDYLRQRIDDTYLRSLQYCPNRSAALFNQLWLRYSPMAHLLVTGPLTPYADGFDPRRVCAYQALYRSATATVVPYGHAQAVPDDSPSGLRIVPPIHLQQAFAPFRAMLRLHATIKGDNPLFNPWLK